MDNDRRNSNSSKMRLVAPRRGLRRTRSVFIDRNSSTTRNNDSKYRVDKRPRPKISQDTGHALDWVDSLINRGRGILDSLEEEDVLFRKELMEDRRKMKIQKQLVENALCQDLEGGYGRNDSETDTPSFRRLEETVRDTLTNYNDNINDEIDGNACKDENKSHDEDLGLDDGQEEIVIVSDEDEGGSQEPHRSEDPTSGEVESEEQGISEGQEIDLISSGQDSEGNQWDELGNDEGEDEFSEGQEEYDQRLQTEYKTSGAQDEQFSRQSSEGSSEQKENQEDREIEDFKDLGRSCLSSAQPLEEAHKSEVVVETGREFPDSTSYYETKDQIEINEDRSESEPIEENVILISDNLPEEQILRTQEIFTEQQDDRAYDEKEVVKKGVLEKEGQGLDFKQYGEEREPTSEQDQQQELEEDQRQEFDLVEDFDQSPDQGFEVKDRLITNWGQHEKVQSEDPGQQRPYVNENTIIQNSENLNDYREIANQAVQQMIRSEKEHIGSSESNDDEMLDDATNYLTANGSLPLEEDTDNQKFITKAKEDMKVSMEPVVHEGNGFPNIRDYEPSLLEQLFKPKQQDQEADTSHYSVGNESSVFYSIEEPSIVENPITADIERLKSFEMTEKKDGMHSRYEILFCESTYSTTSDEDNQELREPFGTYISPFAEDPFSEVEKVENPKELLKKTLESLGESFDTESEDLIMEDASEFSSNSDEEFFSQTSDINGGVDNRDEDVFNESDNDTIKNLEVYNYESIDYTHPVYEKTPTFADPTSRNLSFDADSNEYLIFGPSEPDIVEEVEMDPCDDQDRGLLVEEIGSDVEEVGDVVVHSEPIIELQSESPNFANIILEEFTAPDVVEEADNDGTYVKNEISLEEMGESQTTEMMRVISTEPIVELPEPLNMANIQLFELSDDENEDDSQGIAESLADPLGERRWLHTSFGEFFNLDLQQGMSNSSEQQDIPDSGEELADEQRPKSVASHIFSSPARALNNVISGIISVGNVLSDFVEKIDAVNAETDSDVENLTLDNNRSDSSFEEKPVIDSISDTSLSNQGHQLDDIENRGANIHSEEKSTEENASDHREILSEVASLQKLAQRLERRFIPAPTEEEHIMNEDDLEREGLETSVRHDNEPELDIGVEDTFLRGDSIDEQAVESKGQIKESKDDDEYDNSPKVKKGNLGEIEGHDMNFIPVDGEKESYSQQTRETNEESNTVAGRLRDRSSGRNVKHGDMNKDIKVYEDKDSELPNVSSPLPIKHIKVDSGDSEDAPLQHEISMPRDESASQIKEVEVREKDEDAIDIPVEIEDEKEIVSENKDLVEKQNGGSSQSDSKKRRGRKRKHSSIEESSKRKDSKSKKSHNRRSRGPITRSRTTPSPSERKTRRNTRTRSKKTQ